ncbi:MAG: DMT family transporter [Bacteroidales bacterium]|nr:DMT family transporter [Bacteroidales bacterium]
MQTKTTHPDLRPTPRQFILGNLCILTATLFFGVNIPVVKDLIPHWMSAMDVTVFRLAGGCVLMWLVSLFVRTTPIARGDWMRVILGGGLGMFSFIFLFNLSLRYGSPIDVSIIMTLPPVFIFLYNLIFRHRRSGTIEYIGVAVGLAGACLVIVAGGTSAKGGSDHLLGDLLAVASALCYAFYLIVLEGPSHTYRPVSLLRWVFLFASVPALFLIPDFVKAPIFSAGTAEAWGLIGFVVLCPTFLAYFLLSPATKMIGSDMVSIYQYLVPVFATIGSVVMHLEVLKTVQAVAMAVIVGGMVLTEIGKRRHAESGRTDGGATSR